MTQQNSAPESAGAPKKKSRFVLVLAILLVVVGLGGGAGAYFLSKRAPAGPPPAAEPGIAALDTFVVNLADPGGRRFLRVTLRLLLDSKAAAEELAKDDVARARVRSAILEHLTQQTADRLVTPEGKAGLKQSIAERAETALGEVKIVDVLFTEFVVQF